MIEVIKELEKYGLTREKYEECLSEIKNKINGQSDVDWSELVAKYNLGIHYDTLRKASQTIFGGVFVADYYTEKEATKDVTNGYLAQLKTEKIEIIKERQRLNDERNEYQRLLREQARRESFIELIKSAMEKSVEPLGYLPNKHDDELGNSDMIVCLSDLHTGLEVNASFNKFNTEILKDRLKKYLDEILEIQKQNKCKECHLILGGDLISGLIHIQLRLENNENVVEQVKTVSVLIGDFIKEIQSQFDALHIYSVSGNHSRVSPEKENQLKGEELDALVPFYLSLLFINNDNIHIHTNSIDDTVLSFRTRGGKLFYGVHGDKDSLSGVVKNLTLMTGTKPDGIILGHRHHNAINSEHGVKIIQCGSMIGMDNYCIDHRISGRPEQCVIITDNKSTIKCFYDIGLE